MCDEPPEFRTFRIGLFGMDEWQDVDGTVGRLENALQSDRDGPARDIARLVAAG